MSEVEVENLTFTFEATEAPFQYEVGGQVVPGWPTGAKVVDIVLNHPGDQPGTVWLIEAKDFRIITNPPKPTNLQNLAETVAQKAKDTLGALASPGQFVGDAKAHADAGTNATAKRVVLHLEPHPPSGARSKLFPQGFSALILQKLRQLLVSIDSKALVLDIARTPNATVPWTVA